MNGVFRGIMAFLIGSAGVALGFYGALEEMRGQLLLGTVALLAGVIAFAAAFRLSPND